MFTLDPFTRPEVVTAGGVDPWQRQEQFSGALNFGDMAQAISVYRQAAVEATTTGDLSRVADDITARSGDQGGTTLADTSQRAQVTDLGMQGNGKGMDETANVLTEAMNWAIDEDAAVRQLIAGLEADVQRRHADAWQEMRGWDQALRAEIDRRRQPGGTVRYPGLPPLTIHHAGESWQVTANGTVYELPQDLADHVRQRHLDFAGQQDGQRRDAEIADEIDQYRRTLGGLGKELIDQGYDLADGPLKGLWTGPAIAEIDARMLREELAKPEADRDPAILELYTQGLRGIGISVENPPGGALGELDMDDRAYLRAFFPGIDETMALGIADAGGGASTDLANGYTMLTNPTIGGINPADPPASNAPDPLRGIRSLLYDNPDTSAGFADDMNRFNRFGDLMGSATVMPGHEMAADLARAAVAGQDLSASQHQVSDPSVLVDPITNTGSSGLLHNASLNGAASNGILNDAALREDLLGTQWDVSRGMADVVTSGTTIPQDILDGPLGHNDPAARPYIEAGHNVLAYAAANPDTINATYGVGYARHGDLEGAVGDTALRYMDMIADAGASPHDTGMGADQGLFGKDLAHAFNLSDTQRQSLFSMMANAEPDVANQFVAGVNAWETERSAAAFQRAGAGELVASDFEGIGLVAGTMEYAQHEAGIAGNAQTQATGAATASAIGGAIKDAVVQTPQGKALNVLATLGLSEGVRAAMGDPVAEAQAAAYQGRHYGSWAVQEAIANGAVAMDYNGAGAHLDDPMRTGDPDDRARWTENVQQAYYNPFVDAMENGYRRGQEQAQAPPQPR